MMEQYACASFNGVSGYVSDFDVFGTKEEALARMSSAAREALAAEPKGPGREDGYPKLRRAGDRITLLNSQAFVRKEWRVYAVSGEIPVLDKAFMVVRHSDFQEVLGIFGDRGKAEDLFRWVTAKDRAALEDYAEKGQTVTHHTYGSAPGLQAETRQAHACAEIEVWPPYLGGDSECDEPVRSARVYLITIPVQTVLKSITAVDMENYGIDQCATVTLTCVCPDKDFDLTGAVYAAAEEFMDTEDGRTVYYERCGFDLGDFGQEIPDGICRKHGFCPVTVYAEGNVDWSENIAEPLK